MNFVVCGDMLFSSRHLKKRLDPRILAYLKSADAVFANAEFCTPERETAPAPGRGYITSVSPETLEEFKDLHIQLVNFANNHTGDFGVQGMLDTLTAAHARGLKAIGIGPSLGEARKARFEDTATGRIGIVAAGVTRSEIFAASDPGIGIAPRPGVSPLRWNRTYVLPPKEFQQLQHIDRLLGTERSRQIGQAAETFAGDQEGQFKFGSLYEGNLLIRQGDAAHVETRYNEKDAQALLEQVKDASFRSDFVLCTVHTHEGVNENWYSDEPAQFIEDFAHRVIDAGASAFVGHGAHFLRGVEIYKGHPIFYNIGSLIMEFEAGESKICPEMYEAYGYDAQHTPPSTLHRNRSKDSSGHFIGFAAERRFSENVFLSFDIQSKEHFTYKIIPIDLDMTRDNPLQRGLPVIADADAGNAIAKRLSHISEKYGTKFQYQKKEQYISVVAK